MKRANLFSTLVTAVAITGISSAALAADKCKDVVFWVKNEHSQEQKIKILKVKFRNAHNGGAWQTENVNNRECSHGYKCSTKKVNINNARNVNLYDFKVIYKFWEHLDEEWSDRHTSSGVFTPIDKKCTKGKNYGAIVVN